jgi:hypothetical protein
MNISVAMDLQATIEDTVGNRFFRQPVPRLYTDCHPGRILASKQRGIYGQQPLPGNDWQRHRSLMCAAVVTCKVQRFIKLL